MTKSSDKTQRLFGRDRQQNPQTYSQPDRTSTPLHHPPTLKDNLRQWQR